VKVLYFGTYSTGQGYPRNRVLIEGLRRAGVEVIECHEEFWSDAAHKMAGATGAFRLIPAYAAAWARLIKAYLLSPPHDVVVVGYTGQIDIVLAKALAALSGRPVVLDAFLSLYDTIVTDRGLVKPGSIPGRSFRFLDRLACRLADLALLDTRQHIRYFERLTGLPSSRFARIFVGEDDRSFPPDPPSGPREAGPLEVLWFGTFVPLQGVSFVIEAARELAGAPVRFHFVGRGQQLPEFDDDLRALPNADLEPRFVTYEELNQRIRACHVSLGVFGTTEKAGRVIPCKVYDALAVGRAVISGDTPGARELLEDGSSALLVPVGDAKALAGAIRTLAEDEGLRLDLARAGHAVFLERASPDALGRRLRELFETRLRTGRGRRR
jgi:glycosyltransferase involved in cell wall biosynthesis